MSEIKTKSRLQGVVVGNRADKTVKVRVERLTAHRLYRKIIRRRRYFQVHDAENACVVGDKVVIEECRRISKTKAWRVIERAVAADAELLSPVEDAAVAEMDAVVLDAVKKPKVEPAAESAEEIPTPQAAAEESPAAESPATQSESEAESPSESVAEDSAKSESSGESAAEDSSKDDIVEKENAAELPVKDSAENAGESSTESSGISAESDEEKTR